MAVAGNETTILAPGGTFANVTPFLKDLPAMDMVEIGDAAMCFDDPIFGNIYPRDEVDPLNGTQLDPSVPHLGSWPHP